ncbi:MAG: hypothetical protein AAGF11_35270 [Myxococcota bacterium]
MGLPLAPRVARACSCAAPPAPEKALEGADAVFEARPFSMSSDTQRARYRFEVNRVWKGDIAPRVEITTAVHSATCGRSYQMGIQYVVYARRSDSGEWADTLCSRTRPSRSAAEDLQVLGAGRPPVDANSTPPPAGSGAEPTEPPRIEVPAPTPPPVAPRSRGCAVEMPHAHTSLGGLVLLGLIVAIGRRRTVRS